MGYIARDINDFKIAAVTADTSVAYTVGTLVDLPGVSSFTMSMEYDTDELRGDAKIQDIYSKLDKVTGSFGGIIDFDVFEEMLGGRILSAAGYETFRIGPEFSKYVYIETQTVFHGEVGDIHARLFKARITGFNIEQSSQNYMVFTADYEAIPTTFQWENPSDATDITSLILDLDKHDAVTAITVFEDIDGV